MKLKELYEARERSILTVLGQQPEKVSGDFSCCNKLTSLEGAPRKVGKHFYCSNNKLTSLEGAPKEVGGNFICYDNKLTSLQGSPKEVGGTFHCHSNKLASLEGGPQKVGADFICSNNQLSSLEGFPKEVGKDFYCSNNKLTNLKDIHKHIKSINGFANFYSNPIESHVVGLLLIDGLTHIYLQNEHVQDIINKHLKANKDVLGCIDELEEAGFSQFAKI